MSSIFCFPNTAFPTSGNVPETGNFYSAKIPMVPRCSTKYIKILTFTNVKYPVNKYKTSNRKTRAIKVYIEMPKKWREKSRYQLNVLNLFLNVSNVQEVFFFSSIVLKHRLRRHILVLYSDRSHPLSLVCDLASSTFFFAPHSLYH